jgi:ABC-type multidrug transport system fused ATPase/permease subunit
VSEQKYNEKQEEKEEKQEEKEEKSWDEKWRRDPLNAAAWATILIWAGLVLLAGNLGLLDRFEKVGVWGFIFIGAGLILIGEVLVRLFVPQYRQPVAGSLILGVILLAVGLGNLISWGLVLALVLIAIGIFLLFRGLILRR